MKFDFEISRADCNLMYSLLLTLKNDSLLLILQNDSLLLLCKIIFCYCFAKLFSVIALQNDSLLLPWKMILCN